mmetsp:Transcript_98690/g.211522  ORF Transcript_98690/g.211522 Transcript_98690/m.211522 type:complete len:249 (-) Transcript_98690:85-831(-)
MASPHARPGDASTGPRAPARQPHCLGVLLATRSSFPPLLALPARHQRGAFGAPLHWLPATATPRWLHRATALSRQTAKKSALTGPPSRRARRAMYTGTPTLASAPAEQTLPKPAPVRRPGCVAWRAQTRRRQGPWVLATHRLRLCKRPPSPLPPRNSQAPSLSPLWPRGCPLSRSPSPNLGAVPESRRSRRCLYQLRHGSHQWPETATKRSGPLRRQPKRPGMQHRPHNPACKPPTPSPTPLTPPPGP